MLCKLKVFAFSASHVLPIYFLIGGCYFFCVILCHTCGPFFWRGGGAKYGHIMPAASIKIDVGLVFAPSSGKLRRHSVLNSSRLLAPTHYNSHSKRCGMLIINLT